MPKFLLAVFVFSACLHLYAAKINIAVISDSDEAGKAADIISSKLSSTYAVREQKLSKAVIGSKEIIQLSKLYMSIFLPS